MSCSQHLQHTPDSLQQAEIFPDPDSGILWTLSLLLAAEIKCCAESKKHWQLSEEKVFALPHSVWLRKFIWDFTTEMRAFLGPERLATVSAGQCSTNCKMLHKCLLSAPTERHLSRGVASSQVTRPLQELPPGTSACSPRGAVGSQAAGQGLHAQSTEVWETRKCLKRQIRGAN